MEKKKEHEIDIPCGMAEGIAIATAAGKPKAAADKNKRAYLIAAKCATNADKIIAPEHLDFSTFQFGPQVTDPNEIWRSYQEKSWE